MSISSAMQTAVAGLKSNATAVGKISENIANTGTVGYKRNFVDMVTTTGGGTSGSGVRAVQGSNVSIEGTQSATSSMTDLAISGKGFFMVSKNPNDPVESNYFLTRAGSFKPDENGNLRNAAGYYLAGFVPSEDGVLGPVDYTTVASLRTVNTLDASIAASPTTEASVSGNLPASETGTGEATAPFISTMRYNNALGGTETLQLSWQASDTVDNLWSVTISGEDGVAYGTVDVAFSDSGATPGAPASFTGAANPALPPPAAFVANPDGTVQLTIDNADVPQQVTLTLGSVGGYEGVTQFDGDYSPQTFDVDGSEATALATTELDDKGILWGIYENGSRKAMFQVPVATVANPDGLRAVNGNAWSLTRESGAMALSLSGQGGVGTIQDYTLEQSNVDVAQEMTDLIQTQRAYSSNAKIIQTSDEMLQETTNLKR